MASQETWGAENSGEGEAEAEEGLSLQIGEVNPTLADLEEGSRNGFMQVAVRLNGGELVAAVPIRPDLAGAVLLVAVPAAMLAESEQPRSPNGGVPLARAVKAVGPRQGTSYVCDCLFLCLGEEAFASGRVSAWESHGDGVQHPGFCFGPRRNLWPDGEALLEAANALGYDAVEDAWATASEALEAPAVQRRATQGGRGRQPRGQDTTASRMAAIEAQLSTLSSALLAQNRAGRGQDMAPPRAPTGTGGGGDSPEDEEASTFRRGASRGAPLQGLGRGSTAETVRGIFAPPRMGELPSRSPAQLLADASRRRKEAAGVGLDVDEPMDHGGWAPSSSDPLGALMLAAAHTLTKGSSKKKKKKKKRVFGLEGAGSGSSDSSDGSEIPDGRGSKGLRLAGRLMRSMDEHAVAFNEDMRERMQSALAEATDHEVRSVQYVERLPMQNQKLLGYFAWTMAHLNKDLKAGRHEMAELRTLRVIAAIEQNLLDQHWRTAWPLTGLPEPPWPTWQRTDVQVHRKTFSASPLLSETWISAAIGKSRDEAYLRQQRFTGKGDGKGGDDGGPPPGGRGRGA